MPLSGYIKNSSVTVFIGEGRRYVSKKPLFCCFYNEIFSPLVRSIIFSE